MCLRALTGKTREEEAFRLRNRSEGLFRVKRWRSWGLSGKDTEETEAVALR